MSKPKRKVEVLGPEDDNRTQSTVVIHNGGTIRPWQPGKSGNPGGRSPGLKIVRQACRKMSMDNVNTLSRIVMERVLLPDGSDTLAYDPRAVIQAADKLLVWAWGAPPDYDPSEDRPDVRIDTSVLSVDDRSKLLDMLRKGLLRDNTEPQPQTPQYQEPEDDEPGE
jgi:hypothetical protein